jgi:Tfp pilus assembly protein PilF
VVSACSRVDDRQRAPSPESLVAQNNRGVGLMGQFDYEAARSVFAALSASSPTRLDLQVNLAIATLNRQREGDEKDAQQILERVLAADAQHVRAHYALGLLLLNDGRAADAQPHFTFAAERTPADAHATYYIAQCRFQQNDPQGALTWYQRTLTLNPRLRSAAYGAFQALQRLGRTAEAEKQLAVFRALETNPQSELVEFKYTRMGRLAEPIVFDAAPAKKASAPSGPIVEPTPIALGAADAATWRTWTPPQRPSITAADIDGDGLVDLFIAGALSDPRAPNAVWMNRGSNGFVLDLAHPLAAVPEVTAALWGDYDNDGLVDVYLCRRGPNQLWRQTTKGAWTNVTAAAHADGGGATTVDGALFDADHDGDLDVLLIKSDGANELLNNNGDGTFRSLASETGLAGDRRPSAGVVIADLDADRDADIIVVKAAAPHQVLLNDRSWRYHRDAAFDTLAASAITAAVAGDLDADGQIEIYSSGSDGIRRWMRAASGVWESTVMPGSSTLAGSSQLALVDLDGDGRLDLLGTSADGHLQALAISDAGTATPLFTDQTSPVAGWAIAMLDAARGPSIVGVRANAGGPPLLWRPGTGRFPFVAVSFTGRGPGTDRVRSNASGIGTQIAVRADSRWTALATYRSQSGAGQSLQPVAMGTGGLPQIDFVAMTWSDGVFQTELGLRPGASQTIAETERQLSSCPVLFAFDGHHFAFVTDLLGVGGIGTPTSPGVYDPPRPRENILLPEGLLVARNGRYELKLTEPMEEAAYIDSVRLVAYDIPPGWSMALDERKATAAPEATGKPRFYRDERLPVRAFTDENQDVTRAVTIADGIASPPGKLDPRFIGRTADRVLTLEFDRALDDGQGDPMLLADGWIEYPYAQTLFAAWQAGAAYHAPSIEARGGDGGWHMQREAFGYPAGMPRRMSVPLGRLPTGTTALRLRTTQEIYWDRLAVVYAIHDSPQTVQMLPLAAARLASNGFPRREMHADRRPSYDYDRRAALWDTRFLKGRYTTLGPVDELLANEDGALAIFGPGEELHLEFAAPAQPPPAGWTRRFVLEARGWCKDMDLYTKDGETVEPLPGRRAPRAEQLQLRYTTRYQSGQ